MTLTIRLSEDIIHREALLNRLLEVIIRMDNDYWKYSVERIKASEKLKTIKSKILIELLNALLRRQKEVAVLIAMIRGISIVILENVIKVRRFMRSRIHTNSDVSIYWKDDNYVLKMKHDLSFLNQTITMRWWLGFIAEDLVLPPVLFSMKVPNIIPGNEGYPTARRDSNQSRLQSSKSNYTQLVNHAKQLWMNNHRRFVITV